MAETRCLYQRAKHSLFKTMKYVAVVPLQALNDFLEGAVEDLFWEFS